MIHPNRPLVFVPMVFVFLLCISIRILYSEENNRYHHKKDKPVCAVKTDFVRCILSSSKHMNKIKILLAQKPGAVGMSIYSFSATQEVCSKLENQAKCDSAHVLIARIGYYS